SSGSASVAWDGGAPAYDPDAAGSYTFTGTLTPPAGSINTDGLQAAVQIIVAPRLPGPVTPLPETSDGVYRLYCGLEGCSGTAFDELNISVPAGTHDRAFTWTVQKTPNIAVVLPVNMSIQSPVYELKTDFEGTFLQPVELEIKLARTDSDDGQTLALFRYDETEEQWTDMLGCEEDNANCIAAIQHTGQYAVFAVDEPPVIAFHDIARHWARASILQAASEGLVSGDGDGSFAPDRAVTRAEFVSMLARAQFIPQADALADDLYFTDAADVPAWAETAIARAHQAGIVQGYADGAFRPGQTITRTETAIFLARALQLSASEQASAQFADGTSIPQWGRGAVGGVWKAGIMQGQPGNRFDPYDRLTRAEAVVVLLRAMERMD
ncbi:S-layer homology domain-containing protein, partial [Paenibacillus sp. IB182496]